MCQHYYRNRIERMVYDLQKALFLWSGLGEQRLLCTDGKDVS